MTAASMVGLHTWLEEFLNAVKNTSLRGNHNYNYHNYNYHNYDHNNNDHDHNDHHPTPSHLLPADEQLLRDHHGTN